MFIPKLIYELGFLVLALVVLYKVYLEISSNWRIK